MKRRKAPNQNKLGPKVFAHQKRSGPTIKISKFHYLNKAKKFDIYGIAVCFF